MCEGYVIKEHTSVLGGNTVALTQDRKLSIVGKVVHSYCKGHLLTLLCIILLSFQEM